MKIQMTKYKTIRRLQMNEIIIHIYYIINNVAAIIFGPYPSSCHVYILINNVVQYSSRKCAVFNL